MVNTVQYWNWASEFRAKNRIFPRIPTNFLVEHIDACYKMTEKNLTSCGLSPIFLPAQNTNAEHFLHISFAVRYFIRGWLHSLHSFIRSICHWVNLKWKIPHLCELCVCVCVLVDVEPMGELMKFVRSRSQKRGKAIKNGLMIVSSRVNCWWKFSY